MARNRAQKQNKSNIKKKKQFFNNLAIHKTSKFKFWLSSLRGDNEQSHDCYVNKDLARKLPRRSVCGGSRWSSIPVLALIHRLTSAGVHDAKIHSGTAWRTWLSRNWISAGYQRLICPALNTITPHGRRISAQPSRSIRNGDCPPCRTSGSPRTPRPGWEENNLFPSEQLGEPLATEWGRERHAIAQCAAAFTLLLLRMPWLSLHSNDTGKNCCTIVQSCNLPFLEKQNTIMAGGLRW